MEYLVMLIMGLAGFAYYQYDKRKKAETENLLSKTKGKDSVLAEDQKMVKDEVAKIDEAIENLNNKRKEEAEKRKHLTLKERKDQWKKR